MFERKPFPIKECLLGAALAVPQPVLGAARFDDSTQRALRRSRPTLRRQVLLVGKRTCDKLKWSPLHCDVHVAEAHGAAPLAPREEWPDEAIAAVAAYPRWFHWFALMWRQLLVFQAK